MSENGRDLSRLRQMKGTECQPEQKQNDRKLVDSPTIHHTNLPDAHPDSPLRQEWSFYRREVARLLAEGHEGRFILIKGESIVGIWNTHEEARAVALRKYLMQPCLIHQVRSDEPLLRLPTRLRRCLLS